MTKDLNKGITKIEYNSLNLPKLMDIKSPLAEARKEYIYTAGGAKLRVVSKWNPSFSTNPVIGSDVVQTALTKTKTTDYVGNIVYEDNALKRILVDGGYIEGGVYNFYLTDHLGNNRAVAKADASIIQRTQYYPFGAAFADGLSAGLQPYKYNGKELDAEHGVNWYDYSARQKSDFGFTSVDPHAERYYSMSPYVYCGNNPIRFIDPTGMDSVNVNKEGTIVGTTYKNDGNNRFYDEDGNEFVFNDSDGVDDNGNEIETNVGGSAFYPLSKKQIIEALFKDQYINGMIYSSNKALSKGIAWGLAVWASHNSSDFAHKYLVHYAKGKGTSIFQGDGFRGGYIEPGAYFKFEGDNTLYNLYDAGNFMWGAWTQSVGFTPTEAKVGSQLNEGFGDVSADQRAIKKGVNWFNNLKK